MDDAVAATSSSEGASEGADETAALKAVPLFSELSDAELAGVRAIMPRRRFAPGQVIIREGESGDLFYVITDGAVEFSTLDATGRELVLGRAGAGGFFGELSMLTGEPRAVRVRATDRGPVDTLALDRAQFHEFLAKHPAAAIHVLTAVSRRLHQTDQLLRTSASRNVNEVMDEKLTLGQRVADGFAAMMGSWPFIIIQSCILVAWVVLNVIAWQRRWDPYPFILLNLALSFQAAYAAPIIMMSQNRAGQKDRLAAEIDHEVNVKAEVKVGLILRRLDELERSTHYLHEEQRALLKQLDHSAEASAPRNGQ